MLRRSRGRGRRLVALHTMGLGARCREPGLNGWHAPDRLRIGGGSALQGNAVGLEAADDGRVHRVSDGKWAKKIRAAAAESRATATPKLQNPRDISLHFRLKHGVGERVAKLHRQILPKRGESGMHL